MRSKFNLSEKVFGRLTVISRAESGKYGSARWNCLCACGKESVVRAGHYSQGFAEAGL